MMKIPMKTCRICGESKMCAEFNRCKSCYDGFSPKCKSCHKKTKKLTEMEIIRQNAPEDRWVNKI